MQAVGDRLRSWVGSGDRLCVAYSGGLDSTVLLHSLAALRGQGLFDGLAACHVHHGLSSSADTWALHCREVCDTLNVAYAERRISVDVAAPEGIEAAARVARYQALADVDAEWVVLAHHRDDQAETLLLNLLRGAGVHGAAAMPARHGRFLRPLLGIGRGEIEAYVAQHGLSWIEDGSNADVRYTRNFLRQQVMPRLVSRFPAASARLAASAGAFAEARELLDDLAVLDGAGQTPLPLSVLRALSVPRAANALTFHLRQHGVRIPGREWLRELLRQLLEAGVDRQVSSQVDGCVLHRYRDALWLEQPVPAPLSRLWAGENDLPWADRVIRLRPVVGQGVARRLLVAGEARFGVRGGGETVRLRSGGPRRPVKDLLREAGVPPWRRQMLPVLFVGGRVAWVAGIGMDADFGAGPEEDGICLEFDAANW